MIRFMFGLCMFGLITAYGMGTAQHSAEPQWQKTVRPPQTDPQTDPDAAPRTRPERNDTAGLTRRVTPRAEDEMPEKLADVALAYLMTRVGWMLAQPEEPTQRGEGEILVNRPHRIDWDTDLFQKHIAETEKASAQVFEADGFSPGMARFMAAFNAKFDAVLDNSNLVRNQDYLSGCEIRGGIKRCPVQHPSQSED